MSEDRIKRKNLWKGGLNNIKQSDWIKLADKLGLSMTKPSGGTSHTVTIRDPKMDADDSRSAITTVQVNLFKQANLAIFKRLLDFGIAEDQIWFALGLIKKEEVNK